MKKLHIKRKQVEMRSSNHTFTYMISEDKYQFIKEKMADKLNKLGRIGKRFEFKLVPTLRGGGELIRAELIFNDANLTD
jgi:hypothetical protein